MDQREDRLKVSNFTAKANLDSALLVNGIEDWIERLVLTGNTDEALIMEDPKTGARFEIKKV